MQGNHKNTAKHYAPVHVIQFAINVRQSSTKRGASKITQRLFPSRINLINYI